MIREVLTAAAFATAMPGSAQPQTAIPQPVVVGILDVAGTKVIGGDKRAKIEYREFNAKGTRSGRWNTKTEVDHGEVVVTAFVEQIRAVDRTVPIRIFAANATYMHPSNPNALKFHHAGAKEALQWFAENNVKLVVTTMTSKDTPEMQDFMSEAKKLGLVVFASAGNDVVKGIRSFPAGYPDAISVVGDNPSLALRKDETIAGWVKFAMDGEMSLPGWNGEMVKDEGSSMAVARAGALAAYAVATGKAQPEQSSIEGVLTALSQPKAVEVPSANASVTVSYIPMKGVATKFSELVAKPQMTASAEIDQAVLAALAGRSGASR